MSDHDHEMIEAALSYARLGWHVFPCWWVEDGRCACGNPECKSPGKHPIGQVVPGGQNNATTDEATIRAWWGRYPKANIAVNLRASGLCAIDVDPRNGGLETVDQVEGRYGKVESDVMQFTGGGGWHAVFQLPADVLALPGKLGPRGTRRPRRQLGVPGRRRFHDGNRALHQARNPRAGAARLWP